MTDEGQRGGQRGLKFQMLVAAAFAIVGVVGVLNDGAPLWWVAAVAGAAWWVIAAVRAWYRRS